MKNPTVNNHDVHSKSMNLQVLAFPSLLISLCLLFITACQQESNDPTAKANSPVDVAKVTALEELGHKFNFTETDYQHYVHGVHELNAEELELFNDLETKRFLAAPNLREGDRENIVRMRKLKKELNERTLREYNKPYNQLAGTIVIPIVETLDASNKASGGKVASCPYTRKFPSNATVGAGAKVNCSNFANVQKEGQSDCDYQYSFVNAELNGYGYVVGKTPKAQQLLLNPKFFPPQGECRGFYGSVARRRSGDVLNSTKTDYTGRDYCLLLGKDRVDWCFGSGSVLYNEIAMGI